MTQRPGERCTAPLVVPPEVGVPVLGGRSACWRSRSAGGERVRVGHVAPAAVPRVVPNAQHPATKTLVTAVTLAGAVGLFALLFLY